MNAWMTVHSAVGPWALGTVLLILALAAAAVLLLQRSSGEDTPAERGTARGGPAERDLREM